jgi:hypothetical protein
VLHFEDDDDPDMMQIASLPASNAARSLNAGVSRSKPGGGQSAASSQRPGKDVIDDDDGVEEGGFK